MNCNRCGATWSATSSNSQDSQLESLLQAVVSAAQHLGPGTCQIGDTDRITGAGIAGSQQYHADQIVSVETAMNAVHSHIQQNYEED